MIEHLDNANLKKLRSECTVHQASSNFEQLCRIVITGLAIVIDQTLAEKRAAANKMQDRGS